MVSSSIVGIDEAEQRPELRQVGRLVTIPAAVAAYAFTLHWVYLNLVTGPFRYLGYTYSDPTFHTLAFTYIAAALAAWILPSRLRRPSDLVLWVVFIVAAAPAILVPAYAGYQTDDGAMLSGVGIAGAFILATLISRRSHGATVKPLIKPVSHTSFWLLVGIYTVAVYIIIHFTLGLSLNFIGLLEVYDQRDEYRSGLAGTSGIVGYMVSTQANVVNPLIIARGIYSRRWSIVALGVLGQALLYSGTGFKTVLFSVPAIAVFALLMWKGRELRTTWLLWGGVSVAVVAAIVDNIQGDILWTSLFSRRFLITPGVLTAAYMQFYSENPHALLSHSILNGVTEDHYGLPPARVIGMAMTANPEAAANANVFADGYANFGILGVAGAAIILGIYLRVLDRVSIGIPPAVTTLVVIMPAVALSNTSALTAMLSHGLVAAALLLAIAPRDGWMDPHRKKRRQRRQQFYAIDPHTGRLKSKT